MTTQRRQIGIENRGRPAISQDVMNLISDRVYDDMEQPEQLPRGVLAYRIHETLKESKKKKKKMKIPAVSTIEKIISEIRKNPNPQEQPWDILKLGDKEYPIPSEAIPLILRLWAGKREQLGRYLTVREARWAGRLYALAKDVSPNQLAYIVQRCANQERLLKEVKFPKTKGFRLRHDYSLELGILEVITGQKIDSKRAAKILGHREFNGELIGQMLFGPDWRPMPELGELVGERQLFKDIGEADNE